MGPIATAVLGGCLNALQWLLWFAAALVGVTLVLAMFRGDASQSSGGLTIFAVLLVASGWGCGWAAKKVVGQTT